MHPLLADLPALPRRDPHPGVLSEPAADLIPTPRQGRAVLGRRSPRGAPALSTPRRRPSLSLLLCACARGLLEPAGNRGQGVHRWVGRSRPGRDPPRDDAGLPDRPGPRGQPTPAADFRGKPVVAVMWGSCCAPCRAEAPDVVAAAKEVSDRAQFVGINIRDPYSGAGARFVRTFDVPYPSYFSPDGEAMLAFSGDPDPQLDPQLRGARRRRAGGGQHHRRAAVEDDAGRGRRGRGGGAARWVSGSTTPRPRARCSSPSRWRWWQDWSPSSPRA